MTAHKVVGPQAVAGRPPGAAPARQAAHPDGRRAGPPAPPTALVQVDKPYRFDTDHGPASLAELFHGRSQLLVYHFMFGPSYRAGDPVNSSIADTLVPTCRPAM